MLETIRSRARALISRYQFEIFAALALAVVTGLSSRFAWDGWWRDFQAGLLIIMVWGVAHYFWPRRGLYWDLVMTNALIGAGILVLVGLAYGLILPEFGFYYLFWSGPYYQPLLSSFAIILTIAVHWLLLYFLFVDTYQKSLDVDPDDPSARGLDRDEQSLRHAQRLWREFGFPSERTGREPGRFVFQSTKPFAVLLAIPALLPRYAVVHIAGDADPWRFHYLAIALPWLLGLVLGLAVVNSARFWIASASRLEWTLRDRSRAAQKKGVTELLDFRGVSAVVVPVLAILALLSFASSWHWAFPLVMTLVLMTALFVRAYHLRCTAGSSVASLPSILFNDYLIVLLGVIIALMIASLLVRWAGGLFASTLCICYLMVEISFVVAVLDWLFTSQSHARQVSTVVCLLGVLLLNGLNPFKFQFDGLIRDYQREEDDRIALKGGQVPPPLLDDQKVLEQWKRYNTHPDAAFASKAGGLPKLVVVACSGGALRAAVWTALVLGKIEEHIEEFPQSLRLITGASGGMLGAAHYVTELEADGQVGDAPLLRLPRAVRGVELARQLKDDFWTPSVHQMVFGDVLRTPDPTVQSFDRGKVLEQSWRCRLRWLDRTMTFARLHDAEAKGARPSLVFTPMVVEDSRRLFISNLDLVQFTINHGQFDPITRDEVYDKDGDATFPSYSRMGIQFFRLFPHSHTEFPVSSAVRMSATFPLISPAVSLPTKPPVRIVDAGYYDNYGVDFAVSWLEQHREWLVRNTSGVALIQIRAFTNEEKLRQLPEEDIGDGPIGRTIHELGNWFVRGAGVLTSPLSGVANARQMVMSYRNDSAVEGLKRRFTFDRLEWLTQIHDADPEQLDDGAKRRLEEMYKPAQDFFRVFTFTCGKVTQPGETGAGVRATAAAEATPDRPPVAVKPDAPGSLPALQGLPEVETMNWFVTDDEFELFRTRIWQGNLDRFNQVVRWFRPKPDPAGGEKRVSASPPLGRRVDRKGPGGSTPGTGLP